MLWDAEEWVIPQEQDSKIQNSWKFLTSERKKCPSRWLTLAIQPRS